MIEGFICPLTRDEGNVKAPGFFRGHDFIEAVVYRMRSSESKWGKYEGACLCYSISSPGSFGNRLNCLIKGSVKVLLLNRLASRNAYSKHTFLSATHTPSSSTASIEIIFSAEKNFLGGTVINTEFVRKRPYQPMGVWTAVTVKFLKASKASGHEKSIK